MSKAAPAAWRNRIVRHEDVDPAQLLANPLNFRIHPKNQQKALAGLINEIGFIDPILVQDGTDTVIDGHLRVSLALRDGVPTIPVQYVDLTDAEANLALASFDPISAMAGTDPENLRSLLDEVSTGDADLMAMLSDLAENSGVIPPNMFNPHDEWAGMPEFDQEDKRAFKSIIVNFENEAAMEAFERIAEQEVRTTTRSIWYPKVDRRRAVDFGYVSDNGD